MKFVGSLDQGTTSTRFIIFDEKGNIVASEQKEHRQIFPEPGWVEHDPAEIWENSCACIRGALGKAGLSGGDLSGTGITNQRETIIAWNRKTGEPYYHAVVWQDVRGATLIDALKKENSEQWLRERSGLLYSPYFSASKIAWLLENIPGLRPAAERGEAVFGTIDTWLMYNLTGRKTCVTDVTNASRYMLMDLRRREWDDDLLRLFAIPRQALPEIRPSVGEVYGYTEVSGPFAASIPVCGILGDQQAALFGQACFGKGEGKNTYGTGCFMLTNTGTVPVLSSSGLITTVAYQEKGRDALYALEGSVAVAGSLVQWTRDSLCLVKDVRELDHLAESVEDSGDVYMVPAFSGLFAPWWRDDARGVIVGLTGYATRAHICRAVLESTAFQVKDIAEAMEKDSGITLGTLKADGGLTNSKPLMKFQADLLGIPVIRPQVVETTALGAAYAAGLTAGVWETLGEVRTQWQEGCRWEPHMDEETRSRKLRQWYKAVDRSLGWMSE
ncbi:glycerol kinase GlpK [Parasphaerochaeta coccoides]|uniref:Glycerol kinase n=1 Tax=Parasphaerochaeta coccoides (strain ATCC BAA-1237 / DSM 17374 / SPN1) TaxID=760011 RepID=F4GJL2_PARC1|nr:glycerol kinase GlpK [Parasphaerochaeta coccoides]AEC02759.1 glycerol kinase [Parasphaerochaeta coccoides DSM 17374]